MSNKYITQKIKEKFSKVAHLYPSKRALLIPLLSEIQKEHDGWLSRNAIREVAQFLELSEADVYGVVSFYDLLHDRYVGKHRIRVCTNISCMLRGADELIKALEEELKVKAGEVTPDGTFSFVGFECLGACEVAPMAMIDDHYYGNLTPKKLIDIVRSLK